jgi:dolichol kinase
MRKGNDFWNEIIRQIMHIIIGLSVIILILLLELDIALIVLFILLCLSILFSLTVVFYRPFTKFAPIKYFLENLSRDYDRTQFPAKGLIFFLGGCVLVLKLFTTDIALTSIVVLTFGDSVSTLTCLFGRAKYKVKPFNRFKTIYGTLLGFIVSSLVALIFIHPLYAIIGSFFGMLAEALSLKLGEEETDDNLIVPLVAGTAIYLARLLGL